ncbi:MAG TPA: histidinol-phosphatase [Pseudonocardiaceae bacterium]|nr:histidinol-phosphatase [Pseudonocardiaceae bacterium]
MRRVLFSDDLNLALRLADAADAITLDRYGALDLRVDRKPDRSPVTDADVAVEDAVRALLARERPGDAIVGEERGGDAASGRVWMLDPIDGTKNFLRGIPAWGTLIALVVEGRPVVGVASSPGLGRRWWGADGIGAWAANGDSEPKRLSVSAVRHLGDAYLSTTHLGHWAEYHSLERYLDLAGACWETRAFGDFWQHCLVAEGALDIAAEAIVHPWDLAALQVIVEQAGGRFTDLDGNPRHDGGSVLSSNGQVHDAALRVLAGKS